MFYLQFLLGFCHFIFQSRTKRSPNVLDSSDSTHGSEFISELSRIYRKSSSSLLSGAPKLNTLLKTAILDSIKFQSKPCIIGLFEDFLEILPFQGTGRCKYFCLSSLPPWSKLTWPRAMTFDIPLFVYQSPEALGKPPSL